MPSAVRRCDRTRSALEALTLRRLLGGSPRALHRLVLRSGLVKALYDSGWHHPFAAYLGLAVLVVLLARMPRGTFLFRWAALFGLVLAADATITGAWTPLPSSSPLFTPLSIAFVILGDARFFFLQERFARPDASTLRVSVVAALTSLVVPVTSTLLREVFPLLAEGRWLFLGYELLALAFVLGTWLVRYRTALEGETRRWLGRVTAIFATLYALWATADVLILLDVELGHLLRIVPNVLYYAVFLVATIALAPRAHGGAR